jgi:hypothetical protein
MNQNEFSIEMGITAVATRSDIDDATMSVYFKRFASWKLSDFQHSMKQCRDDLARFPTVADIKARYPIQTQTIDDIEREYQPLVGIQESDEERGSDDIEARIDAMTDEELAELFYAMSPLVASKQRVDAATFSVRQFRKNPTGRLYRSVIRDHLRNNH